MNYKIINLPEIAIIGKEGLCTENNNIVQDLWKQANDNFHEIENIGKRDAKGSYIGFWGAMSDETMSFKPWTNNFSRGYYLAGIEVEKNTITPANWTKWILPERSYLIVDVDMENYEKIFNEVINNIIPNNNMILIGAVCDFTEGSTGNNKLLFPIKQL